ncbi:YhcN/YlaJ family sporulation lipoprotein [Sediminibacillus albus]|uniref:Sporulation lipoprotein, YhcN/YlaJ family n=1 Tax=Sediminibacillus albus TaxID=407036 RepID=A0A1G9CBI0_9BACI|nr:YhcN/YlaJ family sporulation lipoprotein [Sediminibacillus albus]SDK49021.1 sporulation lipoprotein, YhcN/YlaJ family [Sediminibacillus albus]
MKWRALGVTLLGTAMLMGCQNDGGNQTGQGTDDGVQQTRFNDTTDYPLNGNQTGTRNNQGDNRNMANNGNVNNQGNQNNNVGQNGQNNDQYEVNEKLADRISEQVDDIDRAYVLTAGGNAYVAAELNKGNNNNTGGNNNGDDGNNANFGNNGNNGNGGDTGTNMNNNQNGNNEVSDEVKEQVSKVVKQADDNIENVYVSTNPDFVNLTNDYVDDVNNGEPIEGFFEQFGEMTERIFPQNR